MDSEQQQRFREAVDRKNEDAERRSHEQPAHHGTGGDAKVTEAPVQSSLVGTDRPQDEMSVRDKNSGKGKKTADKWNQ